MHVNERHKRRIMSKTPQKSNSLFTARRSYASAVLRIVILSLSACPYVRLSMTRVLCAKTQEHTADILIPRERVITLVLLLCDVRCVNVR